MTYRIEPLDLKADRKPFESQSETLNQYFRQQVSQDIKRRVASCFVALSQYDEIAGFYTLAACSVLLDELPEANQKKLPRYPSVPTVLLGRLAVDKKHTGKGLGSVLLADALLRCGRAEIAAYALLVDAKDDAAVAFYRHFGFIPLSQQTHKLFYPLNLFRI